MSYFELPPLIDKMLATSRNVSELCFAIDQPPQVKVNGVFRAANIKGLRSMTSFQTEIIAMTLLDGDKEAMSKLKETGVVDFWFDFYDLTRFHVYINSQHDTYSIRMRVNTSIIGEIAVNSWIN